MATYYIDPSHTFDGDGTTTGQATSDGAVGAHNTWLNSAQITFAEGNTYLGAGGETYTGALDFGYVAAGGMTIGSYGTGKHIFDGSAGAYDKTVRISGPNCVLQDLHIKNTSTGNGTNSHCIQLGGTGVGGFTVDNCILEVVNLTPDIISAAISSTGTAYGWPLIVTNCEIRGTSRGIDYNCGVLPSATDYFYIANNTIHDLVFGTTEVGNSDCIHVSCSAGAANFGYRAVIENNHCYEWGENGLDIIVNEVIIRNNEIGPCLRTDQLSSGTIALMIGTQVSEAANGNSACKVYGNYIHDCIHPTKIAGAFVPRGAFNTEFYSNVIKNVDAVCWTSYAWQHNNKIYNNYIEGVNGGSSDNCIRHQEDSGLGDTHMYCYNNIFVNITSTYLFKVATATQVMHIGNNLTIASYTNWAGDEHAGVGTIIDNGGNIIADPLLDSDYYPYLSSPVIGAGVWTGAIRLDKGGRPFKRSKPSIGAWEIANRDPTNRDIRD